MKKKICIIILSIVIVCSLLSGCGDKHTAIIMKKEKDNIVLMINIDSILAGDNLYLYGGRINDKGVVKDVEAVNKAFEIAKKANLPMQLTPKGNVDYPYPTGQKRRNRKTD